MNTEMTDLLLTSAIEWHVRLRDGDDATWEAFAEWLGEDARNARAYDEVERMDHLIFPLLSAVKKGTEEKALHVSAPPRRRFAVWIGGALAACLVAAVTIAPRFGSQRYEVATRAGEQRVVRLDAHTQVALNGDTRIVLDHDNPRFAALMHGQALFHVKHDADRPFLLEVGEDRIVDLGTVFDVVRDRAEVRVAVAEGRVEFRRAGGAVAVDAGQALSAPVGRQVQVSETETQAVGAWRQKRLLYAGTPLSQVAGDLARVLGVSIRVSSEIASRPVYGNFNLTGKLTEDMRQIEIALDVKLVRQGAGWLMGPSGRARS